MTTKAELAQHATSALSNPKAVTVVSTATVGSGISTYFDWLSNGIGIAASAAGLILAVMMIRKVYFETVKLKIENESLRQKNEEHRLEVEARMAEGLPIRRCDDRE